MLKLGLIVLQGNRQWSIDFWYELLTSLNFGPTFPPSDIQDILTLSGSHIISALSTTLSRCLPAAYCRQLVSLPSEWCYWLSIYDTVPDSYFLIHNTFVLVFFNTAKLHSNTAITAHNKNCQHNVVCYNWSIKPFSYLAWLLRYYGPRAVASVQGLLSKPTFFVISGEIKHLMEYINIRLDMMHDGICSCISVNFAGNWWRGVTKMIHCNTWQKIHPASPS